MSLYLAVEADGTKTECVVADDRRVLARASGDTVRVLTVGTTEATARLRKLLQEVGEQAGVPLYLIHRTCVGLEEVAVEGVRAWAEATLGELLTGELLLVSSEDVALEAAFGEGPGVLVTAGAGSRAIGRCGDGSRFTAGGWGPVLGDEGSAYWIGREGLRSGLRALDRGVPGCLLREASAVWGLQSVNALVARANERRRPDFGLLAEMVARCAAQGDALARSVLERAGEELAAQVSVVLARMRSASCAPQDLQRIAYCGEVLTRMPAVREAMVKALAVLYPSYKVDERAVQPIEGALARARRE